MYVQHQYVHAITQAIIYLPNLTRDGKRKGLHVPQASVLDVTGLNYCHFLPVK